MTQYRTRQASAVRITILGQTIHLGRRDVADRVLADPTVQHLFDEIEMLQAKIAELKAQLPEHEDLDRGGGVRLYEISEHITACVRGIQHIAEGVARRAEGVRDEYLRSKIAARSRWLTARRHCQATRRRDHSRHSHARSQHRVGVARSSTKATATGDPDPSSSEPPGKRGALQIGGAS